MIDNATIYDKWRKMLIKHCIIIACIIFLSEITVLTFFYMANLVTSSFSYMILRFIALPAIINVSAILIGRFIIFSDKFQEITKNYASILILCVICGCVQCVHYKFSVVMCSSCLPIFLSILFRDKKMTLLVKLLCFDVIVLSGIIAWFGERKNDIWLFFDCFIATILLICSYVISIILIRYEDQRTKDVNTCYSKQLELSEQLKHDLLTGLYNYTAFLEILKLKSKNSKNHLHIAVIDLDNFKYINDTYGHIQGNEVIVYISYLLKKYTSNIGYTARYGGEEFVILFINVSTQEAFTILENIRKDFSEHYFEFSQGKKFTFSCGLAESFGHEIPSQQFFDSADRAMYLAKRSGKNRVIIAKKPQYSISSL